MCRVEQEGKGKRGKGSNIIEKKSSFYSWHLSLFSTIHPSLLAELHMPILLLSLLIADLRGRLRGLGRRDLHPDSSPASADDRPPS